MTLEEFNKALKEKIKKPFVFVSYCHENKDTVKRIVRLIKSLEKDNYNVVYDCVGLPPGTDLKKFENLILHKNCKKVLVVNDEKYYEKVYKEEGGVWSEYNIIKNNFEEDKYIVLSCYKRIVPALTNYIYIEFGVFNKDVYNSIADSIKMCRILYHKSNKDSICRLVDKSEELADAENYDIALEKINEAYLLYEKKNVRDRSLYFRILNFKLYILLYKKDIEECLKTARCLKESLDKTRVKLSCEKKACYYLNCALAFRLNNIYTQEYEESIKRSYTTAIKGDIKNAEDNVFMYAVYLFDMHKFEEAYSITKDMLIGFNEKRKLNNNELEFWIKLNSNLIEIVINYSKTKKIYSEKCELLNETKQFIVNVLKCPDLNKLSDNILAQLYEEVSIFFKTMYEEYSRNVGV